MRIYAMPRDLFFMISTRGFFIIFILSCGSAKQILTSLKSRSADFHPPLNFLLIIFQPFSFFACDFKKSFLFSFVQTWIGKSEMNVTSCIFVTLEVSDWSVKIIFMLESFFRQFFLFISGKKFLCILKKKIHFESFRFVFFFYVICENFRNCMSEILSSTISLDMER